MDPKTMERLCSEAYLSNQNAWFGKMREIFEGEEKGPLVLNGISSWHLEFGADGAPLYRDPERMAEKDLCALAERMEGALREDQFRPACVEQGFYGVHFVDRIFGSEVFFKSGQWYNLYLETPVGELKEPDLENNETWNLAKEYAEAFFAAGTTVPLFGLPTIASALNIALNLYGQEILVAMLAEPEAAKHDLGVINDVLIRLHRWYLDRFPIERIQPVISWGRTQPPGYGQLCGCSTQLVSPALYEEFIMPLDDALLAAYPHGGMIHLCGSHGHLIPLFAKMPHLRSVQLNDRASEDLALYAAGLREDQVIYLIPCPGMPLEKGLEIARDRKLIVNADVHIEGMRVELKA